MRAAIFIDGGYLQSQFKYNRMQNPDFSKLAAYLLQPLCRIYPLDLLRCYYYYCRPWMSESPTEDEIRRQETYDVFAKEIESLDRWALRHGKLQRRWDGQKEYFEQKRVDVLLSVDMVRHAAAGHIQHAILLAGDSDFVPAVEAAKESGVTLSLWRGGVNTVHNDLMARCDSVFELDWSSFPQLKAAEKKSTTKKVTVKRGLASGTKKKVGTISSKKSKSSGKRTTSKTSRERKD